MEPQLFVPYGIGEDFSLYEVSFDRDEGGDWGIGGFGGSREDPRKEVGDFISRRFRNLQDYFEVWLDNLNVGKNIQGRFNLEDLKTDAGDAPELNSFTTSVFLGIFLKAVQEFKGRRFKKEWASATISGDIEYINENLELKEIDDIEKKFNAFKGWVRKNPNGNHLFLYIDEKDGDDTLVPPDGIYDNIQVKRFTPDDSVYDLARFVFEPFAKEELPWYCSDEQKRLFKKFNNANKYGGDDDSGFTSFVPTNGYEVMRKEALTDASFYGYFIHGEGGRGKSALAEQLARDMVQEGNAYGALWITIKTEDFIKSYQASFSVLQGDEGENDTERYFEPLLCDFLGIPSEDPPGSSDIGSDYKRLFDTLSRHPYIIVFDDLELTGNMLDRVLDEAGKFLRKIQGPRPYLIFTSRIKSGKNMINNRELWNREVPKFTEEDTGKFFRNISEKQGYYATKILPFENGQLYSDFIRILHREFGYFPLLIRLISRLLGNEDVDINYLIHLLDNYDYVNEEDIQKKFIYIYKEIFDRLSLEARKLLLFMLNFGSQTEATQEETEHMIKERKADIFFPLGKILRELGNSLFIYSIIKEGGIYYGINGVTYTALLFGECFSCNGVRDNLVDPLHLLRRLFEYRRPQKDVVLTLHLMNRRQIDINTKDQENYTPLEMAIYCNSDPEIIELLIDNGSDVNSKDESNYTPLHLFFLSNNNLEILKILLKNNADINAESDEGVTPLQFAAVETSNSEIIQFLLENEIDITSKKNIELLDMAVSYNSHPEIIEIMLREFADINTGVCYAKTLIYTAARDNPNSQIIRVLLDNGANINEGGPNGETPLHGAVLNKNSPGMLETLFENGANVNAVDDFKRTALHIAAEKADSAIIRELIFRGADVNAPDEDGKTPLHAASSENTKSDFIPALRIGGAKIEARDKKGFTPLLTAASDNPEPGVIETLLLMGSDINARNWSGETALHLATYKNKNPNILRVLIKNGADINAKENGCANDKIDDADEGRTPLYRGVLYNANPENIKLLIDLGADIDRRLIELIFQDYISREIGRIIFKEWIVRKIKKLFKKKNSPLNPEENLGLRKKTASFSGINKVKQGIFSLKPFIILRKKLLSFKIMLYADDGHYDRALEYVIRGTEFFPEDGNFWHIRGNMLLYFEKFEEAIGCYDKALECGTDTVIILNRKARCEFRMDNKEKAIKYYDDALKINPNFAETWYNKGRTLGFDRRFDEARECFERAVELDPKNKEYQEFKKLALEELYPKDAVAYNERGFAYIKKGDYDRAISDFNKAIRLDPQYVAAYYNRGFAYSEKGDYDRAIADHSEATRLDPQLGIAYFGRGFAYNDKGDYDHAISDLNKAIRLEPQFAMAYNARGFAYNEKGDYDRAISDLTEAIRLEPQYVAAYHNRGCAYGYKGNYDRAISDITEAIRLDPQLAIVYNTRGCTYGYKGDYDRAILDLNEAIRLDPQDAIAYHNRGFAYNEKGDYDRAIVEFNEAVRLNPQFAKTYHRRGSTYNNTGDYDRAISDFNEAIRLDPQYGSAYSKRGVAYYNKGDLSRAIADFEAALRINPNDEESRINLGLCGNSGADIPPQPK
jgi:tetratricopeptide (TPR) repeat protein